MNDHPRPIALLGLSGVGKSTVARLLADRLGWPVVDTDALIVAAERRPIADIFANDGEPRFRDLEAAALAEALEHAAAIIATGGGIILRPENRALLSERATCIWLDATTDALVARLQQHDEERPLLAGDARQRLEALRAARADLYAAQSVLIVNTAGHPPQDVVETILEYLQTSRLIG